VKAIHRNLNDSLGFAFSLWEIAVAVFPFLCNHAIEVILSREMSITVFKKIDIGSIGLPR